MNALREADFDTFFAALHDGHTPFEWQRRLLRDVLTDGCWPRAIVAPTGAGKTAVLDVHVFALALAATGDVPMPPRRLAMVVDRRVLVDDQHEHAQRIADLLRTSDEPVVATVAERLAGLRSDPAAAGSPLLVGRLRGGFPPSRRWRDDPAAAAILCATPDMWGSRLLFGGYGSNVGARPLEAGLLAFDSVVVVDEAHLARQLLCTARRIAELAVVAETPLPIRPLQVVETTATPETDTKTESGSAQVQFPPGIVGVTTKDLTLDTALQARLTTPKPVNLVPVRDWEATRSTRAVQALADAAVALREHVEKLDAPGTTATVGCFVNTVARAVAVAAALMSRSRAGLPLRVVLVCGQARPIDIELLASHYPGLLTPLGNPTVDVLVSTQSLEVGVDLDLAGVVTELASGTALAQRCGRVNRRGLRAEGPVTVVIPESEPREGHRYGPYTGAELSTALSWIHKRAATREGVAPWMLHPPTAVLHRDLLQRPELGQAWHWARTSDTLAAEPELTLWLADDLDQDTTVGLVVRDDLPVDTGAAVDLVRLLPPRPHEIFAIPLITAREALIVARREEPPNAPPVVVCRGGEVSALQWRSDQDRETPRLRPGDQLVLDTSVKLFTAPAPKNEHTPQVVAPVGTEANSRHPACDRLEAQADLPPDRWKRWEPGNVVLRLKVPAEVAEGLATDLPARERRDTLANWLEDPDASTMCTSASQLLAGAARDSDIIVGAVEDNQHTTAVVVLDRRRLVGDEIVRQEWTHLENEVLLADHQKTVADRAAQLGELFGLSEAMVTTLRMAGLHHDDGKADPRFQIKLGATSASLLAKSPPGTTYAQRRRNAQTSGLTADWRHEQRSVVDAWAALSTAPDPQLAARLIGASHGFGRSCFPRTAAQLMPETNATAVALFDHGDWDELIERTHRRYGLWGAAYLEALLRCADGQVSGAGK